MILFTNPARNLRADITIQSPQYIGFDTQALHANLSAVSPESTLSSFFVLTLICTFSCYVCYCILLKSLCKVLKHIQILNQ